jgi:putative oxidoreductase
MPVQNKLPVVARVLLGLPFVVFGLNGFLQFLPQPPVEGDAAAYLGGLAAAGYFFPLLKATEILAGLALLSGRFVPLALVVLAPVTLHIFAYHAFLAGGVAMPLGLVALGLYLAWAYRDSFRGVIDPKAQPAHAKPARVRAAAHA